LCLSIAESKAPLYGLDSPSIIPNEYLVVYHTDYTVEKRDAHVTELKAQLSTAENIINVFDIGNFIGFSARLNKETLPALINHPSVRYIETNQIITAFENTITQTGATWGIDRIDQTALPLGGDYKYFESGGHNVTAYVIDTGVLITHKEFDGRASWGTNTVGDGQNTDCNGHGTHVAGTIGGIIYGVAKKVTIIAVKVLSCGGSGSLAGVVQGIEWVTKHHTDRGADARSVANMSLGGSASQALDDATHQSVQAGVNHVVAAGNSNANACNYSPARTPSAITAGASTNTDARSSFSNIGTCVDLFAPGTDITSAWIGSSNDAISTISGTSMASPHIAGAVALHLAHLAADGERTPPTPAKVEQDIKDSATPNVIGNPGTGSPNLLLFTPNIDF